MPSSAKDLADAIEGLIKAHVVAAQCQAERKPIPNDAAYAKTALQSALSRLIEEIRSKT